MEAAAPLECKKDGLKQMQSGEWTLVLKVHPNDMPPWLLTAPMGQRLAVVVAALKDEAEKPKERKRFEEMPLSQQCALLCRDQGFHQWLGKAGLAREGDDIDAVVRAHLGVRSRSELDACINPRNPNDPVYRWRDLHARFLTETGRVTEMR